MADEVRLAASLGLAFLVAAAATPLAIRVAGAAGFLDRPVGWKSHRAPTPYLGGAAVLLGLLAAGAAFGSAFDRFLPVTLAALALFCVGLLDDRFHLPALLRVAVTLGAGALLWATDLGWELSAHEAVNLIVTCAWVLGLVNATNLLDLMDGVASSVAATALVMAAVFCAVEGDAVLGALALAAAGGLCGFLPFNLASPSRIFLGDGGSMPIGFTAAAVIMNLPYSGGLGWAAIATGIAIFGIPLLDMTFRIVLRLRNGVSLMTGGPDSLANRLCDRLPSVRAVCVAGVTAQALVGAVATAAADAGSGSAVVSTVVMGAVGLAAAGALQAGLGLRSGEAATESGGPR